MYIACKRKKRIFFSVGKVQVECFQNCYEVLLLQKNVDDYGGVASPKFLGEGKKIWGTKMFDFRRTTACL